VFFELSYDQFHENKDKLFQVYTDIETPKGKESITSNAIPFAPALKEQVSGVAYSTRYIDGGPLVKVGDKTHHLSAIWVDPDFLKMYTFPLLSGDMNTALSNRSSAVITQEAARRLYGDQDPIGKFMEVPNNGANQPVVITGILKDYPITSSINPEVIFNFTNLPDYIYSDNLTKWDKNNHEVYIQLEEGASLAGFEKATNDFSNLHFAEETEIHVRDGAQPNAQGNYRQIKLIPITDIAFTSIEAKLVKVSRNLEYIILGVALLILFIASVNFINMSIARGAQRLREIGMRKTLGARKGQLFFQFWGESLLVFMISILFGTGLAILLLKPFQTLFRTRASFTSVTNTQMIIGIVLGLLVVTFIAGGYPAYLMSKLRTLQALKGKLETKNQNRVRNGLMVIQFSIAILLISGTLVLWMQLDFMRSKSLGFNKEQVISLPVNSTRPNNQSIDLLRNELYSEQSIINITASRGNLGLGKDGSRSSSSFGFEHQGRQIHTNMFMVDYDYTKTLDIEIIVGRDFDRSRPSDSLSVVINESMASQFTEENPLDIVMDLDEIGRFKVIGVIKDFNFQDISQAIEPLSLFRNSNSTLTHAYIKVQPENLAASYDVIKKAWSNIEPARAFLGSYLDENIERTLKKERLMISMISSAALLAIILSCIGLFAMSLLIVAQRKKEIGVRKVVGASVQSITVLLTRDFLKIVILAFIIATPIAWWVATEWLKDYSYHVDVNLWIFIIAGIIAVVIALVTISTQTIKAAMANPVKSLKTE